MRALTRRVTTRSHLYCVLGSFVVFYRYEAERVRPTGRRHLQDRLSMVAGWPVGCLGAALYARVSSAEQKDDVTRQLQRLRDYAAARGYQVVAEVTEVASGLNDERPKLKKLLTDTRVGVLVVEHKNRLTRFGYGYITTLLEHEGRRVEAIYPSDTSDDLVDDLVAVITSMAVRLYGRRNAKRRAAQIQACVKQCLERAEEA